MELSFDADAYRTRMDKARRAWEGGGTAKEVAAILGTSHETARKHQKRWAREAVNGSVPRAIEVLLANGFSREVTSILLNVSAQEVSLSEWRREALQREEVVKRIGPKGLTIDDLEITRRACSVLKRLEISTVGELCEMTEHQLRAAKGCGDETVKDIVSELERLGLSLAS